MASTGFWWILLACALYGVFHSVLAGHTSKAWAARMVGEGLYRRAYRLFFSLMGGLTALPVLALVAMLPDQTIYVIPVPWVYVTTLLQGLALIGLAVGVMQTGALRFVGLTQLFDQASAVQPDQLVVSGLYRWVRHPLYTFSLLLMWLSPVMTWNTLALYLGFSAYLLIGSIFEERKLVKDFGSAYEEYRRRTPRILPWPRL